MSNTTKRLGDISDVVTMSDSDRFLVIIDGQEWLITKENLQKIFTGLSSEDYNKLNKIYIDGNGTKFLTDAGEYKDNIELFNQEQFVKNSSNLIEINDYHTHENKEDILDKFTIDNNGSLCFDGEAISSYSLPVASTSELGGVKIDGTTITIDDDGVIHGSSTYELPIATSNTLGGVKIDNDTIKINDGVISADVIGNWSTGTAYPVGYFVIYNNKLYECISANNDTEWTETKWNLISGGNSGTTIDNWKPLNNYNIGDLVINKNTLFQCKVEHTSEESFNETELENWNALSGEKGEKGDNGVDGEDGFSPTVTATVLSDGVDITITDKNGSQTVGIRNGADGNNGSDGKSAYEIAKDNGFDGDEEDWINSLKGKDGVTTIQTSKVDKTATFSADSWSSTVPYTQTVSVEGITESLNPRIDLIVSDNVVTGKKEEIAYSCLTKVTTGDGILTAYCYETKPDIDFSIMIEVI